MTGISAVDLAAVGSELLVRAADSASGRATQLVHSVPGVGLSHVLLALRDGRELADHENPGEATLHVLSGRVRLSAGDDEWTLGAGELMAIPRRRHAVFAEQDAVALLTVVRSRKAPA